MPRTPFPFPAHLARVAALALVWLALALALVGCVKKPYQSEVCERPDASGCVIEEVEIQGTTVSADKVKEKIATTETSRPLGGALANVPVLSIIDRVQVDYGRVDPFVLERDLARVERFYRSQGYYEAHARAGRVVKLPDGKIKVEIAVDQGRVIKIAKIAYAWQEQPSAADKARVSDAIQRALTDQIKVGQALRRGPVRGDEEARRPGDDRRGLRVRGRHGRRERRPREARGERRLHAVARPALQVRRDQVREPRRSARAALPRRRPTSRRATTTRRRKLEARRRSRSRTSACSARST